jgi:2-dehydropantoate 2-reductase
MRWIVVGAGAVGGVVGGLLANAGEDVTLVARGAHGAAIRADGLRVATPGLEVVVHAPTTSLDELSIDAGDIVVLAVKSQDTEQTLLQIESNADPAAVIVCLQNGLENERAAARRFDEVLSIPVMLPAAIVEPGFVAAWGGPHPGILDIGRYPDAPVDELVDRVSAAFIGAGFASTARAEIARWKRRKLLMNLGNAVQALLGVGGGGRQLRQLATAEGEACFAAAGMDVSTMEEDAANREGRMEVVGVEGLSRGGGSSWQSLVRGAKSIEADYLNGEICLLGRLHGVPTPVNALLQRRANAAAAAGLAPGSTTEEALLAELR